MSKSKMSRRQFLYYGSLSGGALLLAACGADRATEETVAEDATNTPVPQPTPNLPAVEAKEAGTRILIGDVLDYQLASSDWPGAFGSVTFRLHEGIHNGESVYYIRTDGSDEAFAAQQGLVHVPLLANGRDVAAPIYIFDDDRPAVLGSSPTDDDFISLYQVNRVTVTDESAVLESAETVASAARAGQLTIEELDVFVNYPVVKWSGGELAQDTERESYLGTGQLLAPIDTDGMRVTFKLHECYSESRYIITDTSAAPMAPMMSISASPRSEAFMTNGGSDEIWVFANGIEGSGVMGFQPAIFDSQAGMAAWSPFWNHFTLSWVDGVEARLLTSSDDVRRALADGDVELFNGTPNSHPNGFIVNCPVPVLTPNTFEL